MPEPPLRRRFSSRLESASRWTQRSPERALLLDTHRLAGVRYTSIRNFTHAAQHTDLALIFWTNPYAHRVSGSET
jgi:hypothetical protein